MKPDMHKIILGFRTQENALLDYYTIESGAWIGYIFLSSSIIFFIIAIYGHWLVRYCFDVMWFIGGFFLIYRERNIAKGLKQAIHNIRRCKSLAHDVRCAQDNVEEIEQLVLKFDINEIYRFRERLMEKEHMNPREKGE